MSRKSLAILTLAAALTTAPLAAADASPNRGPLAERTSDLFNGLHDSTAELVASALDFLLTLRVELSSEASPSDDGATETTTQDEQLPPGSAECQHEIDPWG